MGNAGKLDTYAISQDQQARMAAEACRLIMHDTKVLWKDEMEQWLIEALTTYSKRAIIN